MSSIILDSTFSPADRPAEAGGDLTQTVTVDNRFSCECVVKIASRLVIDEEGTTVSEGTLCYTDRRAHFEQQVVVGGYRRRKSRRQVTGVAKRPNPADVGRELAVGSSKAGDPSPFQVFAEVTARATISDNGKPFRKALWRDGFSIRDSITIV
jgi:hypothetical protein